MGETVSVTVDPTKGQAQPSLEQQAAVVDQALKDQAAGKAPATPGLPSEGGDRPAWLDPKFKSPEDLAKAYTELSKKLGEKSGEDKPADDKTSDEKQPDAPADERAEARKVAEDVSKKAGLDLNGLSEKWMANGGKLDDADYAALEKAGYSRSQVDTFGRAQEIVLDQRVASVHQSVGGPDAYTAMIEWAGDNLSKDEIGAFNRAVNSDDMNAINLAVKGLKARFDAEGGYEPTVAVKGQTGKPSGGSAYRSVAELDKDMADPRYWNDPAYRRDVEQKLARSDIF